MNSHNSSVLNNIGTYIIIAVNDFRLQFVILKVNLKMLKYNRNIHFNTCG